MKDTNQRQMDSDSFRIEIYVKMQSGEGVIADYRTEAEIASLLSLDSIYEATEAFEKVYDVLVHRPAIIRFNRHVEFLTKNPPALKEAMAVEKTDSVEAPACEQHATSDVPVRCDSVERVAA